MKAYQHTITHNIFIYFAGGGGGGGEGGVVKKVNLYETLKIISISCGGYRLAL